MHKTMVASAMLMATTTVLAQQPARTVQQDFNAAEALDAGTDRVAAVAAWQALESRTTANKRSHAIVLVRKSRALVRLNRRDEALAAVRAGLADLRASDPSLREDRFGAYMTIGGIAESALDYAGAIDAYRQAEALAVASGEKLGAKLGLLRVETFIDPVAASAEAGQLDALLATVKADKTVRGEVEMREAVLALNRGNVPAARKLSAASVSDFGGMSERIDLRDVSARSTAAIAALLSGEKDDARRFMAMTGAGRVGGDGFVRGAQMRVPDCGGEQELKPQDFAVVEFSIANDGSVRDVVPIYAQGGGAVALAFARAARDWSWTPEQVKKLPAFYRYNARVEMRCSLGFERPSIGKLERTETAAWLRANGVDLPEKQDGADAASVAGERAALTMAEAKDRQSLATFAALYRLMENTVVGREETNAFARRALEIATASNAPPIVRAEMALSALRTASANDDRSDLRRAIAPLLADPYYAANPTARSALRLAYADVQRGDPARIEALRQVAGDPQLAKNDPLKVHALIRIASLEQQNGNEAAARNAFAQSGLAANQCAIIDAPPKFLSAGGTYPEEAQHWGFEGWTVTQFDVSADGEVLNQRAILSYPPFVFTKAGTDTVASARYAKSYRPDGGLGCGAQTKSIVFRYGG